jgi:hypothetical protein
MAGMAPAIWGPMAWRLIHGAAHIYDTQEVAPSSTDADIFSLFLMRIAWVLPCAPCRASYMDHLMYLGRPSVDAYFQERDARGLGVILHDFVNHKLGKPIFGDADTAARRSCVWSPEFTDHEVFGLLFVIGLNYDSNQEPDKEMHYRQFFEILPDFCHLLGHAKLAAALGSFRIHLGRQGRFTEQRLVEMLHRAFVLWSDGAASTPSLSDVVGRYNLCRGARE